MQLPLDEGEPFIQLPELNLEPSLIMQEPEPVDWEYYRKGIGSWLVDMYKEAYESELPDIPGNSSAALCSIFVYLLAEGIPL